MLVVCMCSRCSLRAVRAPMNLSGDKDGPGSMLPLQSAFPSIWSYNCRMPKTLANTK